MLIPRCDIPPKAHLLATYPKHYTVQNWLGFLPLMSLAVLLTTF